MIKNEMKPNILLDLLVCYDLKSFHKEEIIQPDLNDQKDIELIKMKLKEYKMNKESNRNLAFLLSTTLSDEHLDEVSGGSNQSPTAFAPSFKITGSSFRDHDFITDASVTF